MRANLAWKRRTLARADAVIAVSRVIARDLRARAQELERHPRLVVIPNPVDINEIRTAARLPPPANLPGPYAIYVGKLAPNKGVGQLVPALKRAGLDWPLVLVGDGPDRAAVEQQARDAGVDARFMGWLDRRAALAHLAHAALLVFPSYGPESLSRVLLEASALGVAVAAMDTGGTGDIVIHEQTGLLSRTPLDLAGDVARLAQDEPLRRRLGEGARRHVERHFAAHAVVETVVALYREVLEPRVRGAARG
jgi:glycosyltransferase involved in cell wall biosynthesis